MRPPVLGMAAVEGSLAAQHRYLQHRQDIDQFLKAQGIDLDTTYAVDFLDDSMVVYQHRRDADGKITRGGDRTCIIMPYEREVTA